MKGKKYVYAHKFEELPKVTDLQLVEEELAPIKDGEVLCEVLCLSIDPYLRLAARNLKEGDDMINFHVAGKVLESKDESFPVDTIVRGPMGCRTHAVLPGSSLIKMDYLEDLPVSLGLGAAGMPSLTAYYGLLYVCKPVAGETLYVNSAAGAVGSMVGQIAKIKGCRVVGSAGSDEKVAYCKSLGFDEVFNYKKVSVEDGLKATCPNGIDMFYENVGGPGFSKVIHLMNMKGRVAVCGSISTYNTSDPVKHDDFLQKLLTSKIKIEGFNYTGLPPEDVPLVYRQLVQWIKQGKIKTKEHVTKGFENFPKAFLELFTGSNFGKAVLMV